MPLVYPEAQAIFFLNLFTHASVDCDLSGDYAHLLESAALIFVQFLRSNALLEP